MEKQKLTEKLLQIPIHLIKNKFPASAEEICIEAKKERSKNVHNFKYKSKEKSEE